MGACYACHINYWFISSNMRVTVLSTIHRGLLPFETGEGHYTQAVGAGGGGHEKGFQCSVIVALLCPTLCSPWSAAHQAPLSMGFSRQGYWSGLPFPSPWKSLCSEINLGQKLSGREAVYVKAQI